MLGKTCRERRRLQTTGCRGSPRGIEFVVQLGVVGVVHGTTHVTRIRGFPAAHMSALELLPYTVTLAQGHRRELVRGEIARYGKPGEIENIENRPRLGRFRQHDDCDQRRAPQRQRPTASCHHRVVVLALSPLTC